MALDFLRVVILLTHNKNPKGFTPSDFYEMAEKVGFEPTHRYTQSTPLAGEPLIATWVLLQYSSLAEREGFEPPVPRSITGFQDRLHKPLGHLSIKHLMKYSKIHGGCQSIL